MSLAESRSIVDSRSLTELATVRLFVALDPPDAVRAVMAELPVPMRGVAWTPPEQYHLTLRFIGDVREERLADVKSVLQAVQVESFLLPVERVGAFPPAPKDPKIIHVGVGSGHPRLFQLRQRIDDALIALGLDVDVKTFEPQFTLGRCGRDSVAPETKRFVRERAEFAGPVFRVDSYTLYGSDPGPAGAVHTPLLTVPLGGGAA